VVRRLLTNLGLERAFGVEAGSPLPRNTIPLDHPTAYTAQCLRERREVYIDQVPPERNNTVTPGTAASACALYVPLLVGDPVLTKRITDALLDRFAIYVQPINYPTVPRGTERLRLTPTPLHSDADLDHLVASLRTLWSEMGLPLGPRAQAAE